MEYSFLQIVIFFFIYCFIGWIWETTYVSFKKRKFVNRGFMHGPIIPIYGFGALGILICTLPFKGNSILIFAVGMLAASLLEYVTGVVMEALFHVRYWDYGNIPTNINGYISIPTSIVWGFLSIIMVKVIHKPIEDSVLSINRTMLEILTVFLTMLGSMDLALSLREAFDLKEILQHIAEMDVVLRMQKRVDVVVAILDSDKQLIKNKIDEKIAILGKGEYKRIKNLLDRNPGAVSRKYMELFDEVKKSVKNKRKY